MAKVLIKNGSGDGKAGVLTIGIGYIQHKTDGKNDEGISDVENLKLLPGLNEVEEEIWARAKKSPVVQLMLEEERLTEVSGTTLSDFGVPRALKLVRDCNDKELLGRWQSQEKRPSVTAAIIEQMKRFDPMPKGSGIRK